MVLDRRAVADALEEIASLLELQAANPFRVRAFAAGARAVRGLADLEARVASGTLTGVKGIGKGLASEIEALARDGRSPLLEELRAAVPASLRRLGSVRGLGPKRARALHDVENIRSLAELEYACRENRLARLKGFGAKTQAAILAALGAMRRDAGLLRRDEARAIERAAAAAAAAAGASVTACGALRRGEVLCDGVDLVVLGPDPPAALDAVLAALPAEGDPVRDGRGVARARLASGAAVRVTAGPVEATGALLVAATGPAGHVRALAARALDRGASGDAAAWGATEEAIYARLGLPFIPPELRGEGAEILEAARGALPRIAERGDLVGALHAHTTWSDGAGSVAEMLDAARAAGLRWLGLSDHSPAAAYAGGLSAERVRAQQEEIAAEATHRPDLRVFRGTECDILGDGTLDYDAATLARFDFVIASVHSRFQMPVAEMTARVVRAVEQPWTTVLGHPTGRLLLGRPGHALDVPEVLRACARHGVAVELNAHPARLDLDPEWLALALDLGVTISIGPDAHDTSGFDVLEHGLAVARRARIPVPSLLNALDADGAAAFFRERRRRGGLDA